MSGVGAGDVIHLVVFSGHVDRIQRATIARGEIARGLCVLVKSGRVDALFPMSELNPAPEYSLDDSDIEQLKALLPLSDTFKVFQC